MASKFEDGSIRAADRITMADEEPVAPDFQTVEELRAKRPPDPGQSSGIFSRRLLTAANLGGLDPEDFDLSPQGPP